MNKKKISYKPLSALVADYIRDAVMNGDLKANERLNQESIARELGVSRMPVREALHQLEADGLVKVIPHGGAYVAPLSPEQMGDIYCVRMLLESGATRLAAGNATVEDIARLESILKECENATEAGDFSRLYGYNDQFHIELYRMSGQKLLCEMIEKLRTKSRRFRRNYLREFRGSHNALEDHYEILDAVRRGAADEGAALITSHLERTSEALLEAATATLPGVEGRMSDSKSESKTSNNDIISSTLYKMKGIVSSTE